MSDFIIDRLVSTAHALKESRAYSASVVEEGIAEITRLRQALSEAQQREKEARVKALEEAAAYHDDLAAQHAASHEHVESDHHEMMERQHVRFASAIRALKDEVR